MGEQSVGKSYALNHLVDTSFAGSAMRTTEGVWMSVTPTAKELVVALDFEGSCDFIVIHVSFADGPFVQAYIVSNGRRKKTHYSSCSILQSQIW